METLTIPACSTPATAIRARSAAVFIDDRRRRDLKVLDWDVLPAPAFGRVRLALASQTAAALPAIGASVLVRPGLPDGGAEFPGTVAAHATTIGDDGVRPVAEVEHRLASALGAAISWSWRRSGQEVVRIVETDVRFNAGGNGLASPSTAALGAREARVFDASASAARWTVADALGYLLAAYVPRGVVAPGLSELNALAGEIDLGEVDVTGLTVGEALVRVARRGGLELRASRDGTALVFYRPGRQGRHRSVRLQPAGRALDPARSNLWRGRIVVRRRPSRPGVLALGSPKRYEATFPLAPGWDGELETPRWRDFVRSESADWPAVADVYRKWVLNEHGWYDGEPWNLPTGGFGAISADDFRLPVPRRFLPCLSCDRSGRSLGVVVEVRCSSQDPWRRWSGPVLVADDECAVHLAGDALPGEFFQAAVAGLAEVRVTATVEADARLSASVRGDANRTVEVIDCSTLAAWRKVHETSVFANAEGLGEPAERDDTVLLERIARRHAEAAPDAAEAELTLGWIDTSFHVGDIIERIDGRGLELSTRPDARPAVASVRHDFQEQSTTLVVMG